MNVADQTSSPVHILYVITKANWGGAQRNVFDLAIGARDAGYRVTVACGTPGELSERLRDAGITVEFISGLGRDISLSADIRAYIHLVRCMRALRPQIVHAHSSKAGFSAMLAAWHCGIRRRIFTAHAWAFNEIRPWWHKLAFTFFHIVTIYAAHTVTCVSNAVRNDVAWLPGTAKKFVLIRNGIAPQKLFPREEARAALAPEFALKPDTFWVGTLAELHRTKGLDVAIEAFAQIACRYQHALLVLIGEGQDRARLTELVAQKNLQDRVIFCGHRTNAASYLSAYDIFLFPSYSEALGYVALEAGVAKLPVVASRVGGIPEIITDTETGMLVTPGDATGFANALELLMQDPVRRVALGTALQKQVLEKFTLTKMITDTLALYKK